MKSFTPYVLAGATGAILASVFPTLLSTSQAQSRLLPFQGRLTNADGTPITPDQAKVVEFKMYDAPTGGAVKWAGEVHKLSVNGGLVNTMLGSKASLGSVDFSTPTFLQITIDANNDNQITAADPPLLPRQSVTGSVYASVAGGVQYRTGTGTFATAGWEAVFNNGRPDTGRIDGSKIATGTISGGTGGLIADGTVTAADLGTSAVASDEIADGSIQMNDLAPGLQNAVTPPGAVIAFAATTAPPGWELCDGRAVSRTDPKYAALFAVIRTSHGVGDGSTTFNLPDYRGRFLRGADDPDGSGPLASAGRDPDAGGRTDLTGAAIGGLIGSTQEDELKSHSHSWTLGAASNPGAGNDSLINGWGFTKWITFGGNATGGSETRPKNAYVNFLIKL